jgi:predicted MFS family arabinose efflux permease
MPPPPSQSTPIQATPTRAIVFLALAAFASQAMVRAADPLLPQIAADVGTTVGAASVITSGYAVSHGATQLLIGPFGDRFPKYAMITLFCAFCAVAVAACGLSDSLASLGIARLICGIGAGTIIPLGIAFIGDTVAYERRPAVLGRFMSGQIVGLVSGQIVGGVVGDHFGWRMVFFVIAAVFLAVSLGMLTELVRNPLTRTHSNTAATSNGLIAGYAGLLARPWVRILLFAVLAEAVLMFGAFAYIGADLHARQGLSFSAIGLVLASFGAGGLVFVLGVQMLVRLLGQAGLVIAGSIMLSAASLTLAVIPTWWAAMAAVMAIGLGFQMAHNTLQVNATQMAPEARATGLALFSSSLYIGQSIGVVAAAPVVDRFGAPPVFIATAIMWPVLAFWFVGKLRKETAAQNPIRIN